MLEDADLYADHTQGESQAKRINTLVKVSGIVISATSSLDITPTCLTVQCRKCNVKQKLTEGDGGAVGLKKPETCQNCRAGG